MESTKETQDLKRLLKAAIEDIPHVGNKCFFLDWNTGHCKKDKGICCYRVHTICPQWKWRGER